MSKIDSQTILNLVKEALEARKNAYAPYSHYYVGAALLVDNDKIYRGCNIENSSYGASNCGERTAIFKAVSEGIRKIKAIAITGGKHETDNFSNDEMQFAYPCGICRQVMREYCNPEDMTIIICKSEKEYKVHTLSELLPNSFGPDNLL